MLAQKLLSGGAGEGKLYVDDVFRRSPGQVRALM